MIKSFLMIGQSNMAGRGYLDAVKPIVNEKIKMLRNGRWQMMAEPINFDRQVAGVSLAASFAACYSLENPESTIGLIPCAEGGSSIDEWLPGEALYEHALSQCRLAMKTSQIIGILWHQGESDSSGEKYKNYYNKLNTVFKSLKDDLALSDTPVLIGGLPDFLGKTGFGAYATEYEAINQALEAYTEANEGTYFITAKGLTSNPDGIHIDAQSQRKFGVRYYEAFRLKKSVLKPLEAEMQKCQGIDERALTSGESMHLRQVEYAMGRISLEELMKG